MPVSATQPLPPVAARGAARIAAGLAVTVASVGVLVVTYVVAVLDPAGRRFDDALMRIAMTVGPRGTTSAALDLVVLPIALLTLVALAALALARGRRDRAVQLVVLVLASEAVTQVLKTALPRPGHDDANSLPSGHVTLVAALAVALLVAVGSRVRPLAVAVAGAAVATAGVATMVAGWHRPSDVLAAVAVVGTVAGLIRAVDGIARPGARASTVRTR